MPPNPLLSAIGLERSAAGRWLWGPLDLELRPGERVGIVGASGCGKSLLLRALAGLDPLDRGKITFDTRPLSDWEMPRYRAAIVYLPQRSALIEGTVEDNFRAIYQFSIHRHRHYDRDRVLDNLAALGRDKTFLTQPTERLSGGEMQIVALVRALQIEPSVLLLDEPTASLDSTTTARAEALVDGWRIANPQRAYLWTSHDPQQIIRVSDRQIILGEARS